MDAIKHRSWVAAVHFHDHIAAVAPGFKPFQNFADANIAAAGSTDEYLLPIGTQKRGILFMQLVFCTVF